MNRVGSIRISSPADLEPVFLEGLVEGRTAELWRLHMLCVFPARLCQLWGYFVVIVSFTVPSVELGAKLRRVERPCTCFSRDMTAQWYMCIKRCRLVVPLSRGDVFIGAYRTGSSNVWIDGWRWVDDTPVGNVACGQIGCGIWGSVQPE